jgi:hypothetical protein
VPVCGKDARDMATSSKPWRWEIYVAGKSKPVLQSDFFESMSEATRSGKAALAEFRAKTGSRSDGLRLALSWRQSPRDPTKDCTFPVCRVGF